MEAGKADRLERVYLTALILLLTSVHLFLALSRPLSEDETYYWEWSRHLDWGYYDGGPMIALWMSFFCSVFGDTELGVRAGAVVASLLLMVVAYVTARDFFGRRLALWAAATLSLTPLAIVGGFLFTYDILQVLFWALAIHSLSKAVDGGSIYAWTSVGIFIGLGLLSKFTMALFVPCMFFYLLFPVENRKHFKSPGPWIAVLLGFLIYLPNLLWQLRHDWITFQHMSTISSASLDKPFYSRMGDFVGAQVAVISPLLFFVCVLALIWSARKSVRDSQKGAWLLWCFSTPILLFFLLSTVRGKVLGNWAACGWYGACLLAPVWAMQTSKRWFALLVGLTVSVLLTTLALWPEIGSAVGIKIPSDWRQQSDRLFGGQELAEAVTKEAKDMQTETGKRPRIAANRYQEAGRLGFYLPGQPQIYCFFIEARKNHYMFWNQSSPPKNGDNFVLALDFPMRERKEKPQFAQLFEKVAGPEEVPIFANKQDKAPAFRYYIYRLYGYRGDILAKP